jgi:hypothetical protein
VAERIESVAAVGWLSGPVRRLAEMVADCPTFQTSVGATNRGDAMDRVHHPHLRDRIAPDEIRLPLAVIGVSNFSLVPKAGGLFAPDACTLELMLRDWDACPERSDYAHIIFANWVGTIAGELCDIHRADPRLGMRRIAMPFGAQTISRPEVGQGRPYWWAALQITWGAP